MYDSLKKKNDLAAAADLLKNYIQHEPPYIPLDPWKASMAGHPALKNMDNVDSFLVSCPNRSATNCPRASNENILSAIQGPFRSPNYKTPSYEPDKKSTDSGFLLKTGACAFLSKTGNADCRKDLTKIEKFMTNERYRVDQVTISPFSIKSSPELLKSKGADGGGESARVTAAPVIKKVLVDPQLTEGLRLAATKMLQQQKNKMESKTNLFDDLKSSFIQAGLNSKEAENKTWDTLAALAATGPNFAKRWSRHLYDYKMDINNINDNPNAYLLQIIAEAIPKLDTQKATEHNGQSYSLPASVSFPCDIGKSYHFWMTAYLSRKLSLEGSSPDSASSSAYISDVGYQLRRESFSGPELKMADLENFGPTETGIRMDLLLAASGAKYGAAASQGQSFAVDLGKLLGNSMKATPTGLTGMSYLSQITPGFLSKGANFMNRLQPELIFEQMK
jgi:hypothetical protein